MMESSSKETCTSWFYLVVGSVVSFFIMGFLDSYGVLMVFLVQHFNESHEKGAWAGSLTFFCTHFFFPITLTMASRFGCRIMLFFASILVVCAFMITPLVPSMNFLFLTFSIPFGLSCSIIESSGLKIIFDYFNDFRGMAFGARVGATTLGTMMYAFLLPVLMAELGWTWSFWILTGMSLFCLFFACVYRARVSEPWKVHSSVESIDVKSEPVVKTSGSDLSYFYQLKDKRFLIFLCATVSSYLVVSMPGMFMVRYATVLGVPISKAKWLMVVKTMVSTVTRFSCGPLGDFAYRHKKLGYVMFINLVLFSFSTFLCSFTTSFPLLMLYMGFAAILDGIHWTLLPLFATEITGNVNADRGFGLMTFFGSFGTLSGPPILGLLYDRTGDFRVVCYTTSAVLAIGACLMGLGLSLFPYKWSPLEEKLSGGAREITQKTVHNEKYTIVYHQEQYISTV